ncbi:MAG: hypothetical protein N2202_10400 [Proteobacteria bacterium]|nr:hypothetical protein [Pseudomonadota bacterium]
MMVLRSNYWNGIGGVNGRSIKSRFVKKVLELKRRKLIKKK